VYINSAFSNPGYVTEHKQGLIKNFKARTKERARERNVNTVKQYTTKKESKNKRHFISEMEETASLP